MMVIGRLRVRADGRVAEFLGKVGGGDQTDGETILKVELGCAIGEMVPLERELERVEVDSVLLLEFRDGCTLRISLEQPPDCVFEAYQFEWSSTQQYHYMKDVVRTDCGGFWYGGGQVANQRWPLARDTNPFCQFLSADTLKVAQSSMERYWLNSNKLALFVEDGVPLWTEHWDGRLSLQAQIRDSCYENVVSDKMAPRLSYMIFTLRSGGDVTTLKDFHMAVHRSLYSGGVSVPDEVVIRHPIWTTWARYKQDISEDKVLQFAEEILEHKAAISQLELDDRWERSYGDFEFDSTRFPNVERMCDVLRSKGIRLSLWIHPFINLDCNNAKNREIWKYMVQTGYNNDREPARVEWWDGVGYVVDFTNPAAVYWFRERLDALKKLGVYSFKFDAGEVTYLPRRFRLWRNGANINDYQRCYAEMAAGFGNAVEVRVCSRTQSLPILVRTLDRLSTWDNAGLKSVLPIALNYSLHGYYFNLPDIVGGNFYGGIKADKELFIRWMQLNQLMVCMQMSKAPWEYDLETWQVSKKIMRDREMMMDDVILEGCRRSCEGGEPVICPMWWLSDNDEALMSSDQFVINDRVIVAPALEKGMTSRAVYLPAGKWRHVSGNLGDSSGNGVYVGPIRIRIEVPLLSSVQYFVKVDAD